MAANNTVEAVLRSKYEDGIEAGVENTRKLMQNAFSSMKDGGAAAAAGIDAAFESTVGSLESWRSQLSKAADESDSSFKKMSLGAAAFGIAATEVFIRAAKAGADFVAETVREASEYFQVKQSFDALTAAAGNQAVSLVALRNATEGQVGATKLMSNASRVMSAALPLEGEQYLKLVENVGRLAKSQGKDAVAAQDALTEALIRGQSRALGPAIGVHLAVTDAVSAMASEMDVSASKIADSSKLTAFYNELLGKTSEAVERLGPSYLTLDEVLTAAKNAQKDLTDQFGAAVLQSSVLQALLADLQEQLLGLSVSGDKSTQVALATNAALISLLRSIAALASNIAFFAPVWENVWAAVKAIFFAFVNVFAGGGAIVLNVLGRMVGVLGYVSGKFGEAAQWLGKFEDKMRSVAEFADNSFNHSFDGVGNGAKMASDLAAQTAKLAGEMEALRGKTITANGALKANADTSRDAEESAKALAQQLETLRGIMFQNSQSVATPEQKELEEAAKTGAEIARLDKLTATQRVAGIEEVWAAFRQRRQAARDQEQAQADAAEQQRLGKVRDFENQLLDASSSGYSKAEEQLRQHLEKIQELSSGDSAETIRLQIEANNEYLTAIQQLNNEELRQEAEAAQKREQLRKEQEKKAISDAIATAREIQQAVQMAAKGTISGQTAAAVLGQLPAVIDTIKKKLAELKAQPIISTDQLNQIDKLQVELDKLNKMTFHPFQDAMTQMKNQVKQFSSQAGQSFSTFFSDLTSGQDNAGKKLLASFVSMIGQMFTHMGVMLIQTGVAECAAALTLTGRLMGANFATGIEAIAAGAALAALGGALSGASSSSSAAPSAAASPASSGSSSTNVNPATINVGASGGAQNSGQAQPTQHIVQLEVRPTSAFVVNAVSKDVSGNGTLRTVIKQVANG
ncbi:MAG TPA: hypothetical protein VHY84_15010 [Bryobacteraceae bacterium]|jgi:hypothetical protein|nr:hypothetical protein [Bryobacteraceae bacterium]